jgi:hypothetical protein
MCEERAERIRETARRRAELNGLEFPQSGGGPHDPLQ